MLTAKNIPTTHTKYYNNKKKTNREKQYHTLRTTNTQIT